MNSYERVMNRLEGKPVDRLPNFNIVMMFAAKEIGCSYGEYITDYHKLVEGNLVCHEKYGLDLLSAISDPMREASGLGTEVVIRDEGTPFAKEKRIKKLSDIDTLKVIDPASNWRMLDRIEGVRLMREKAGLDIPVQGWIEGAMAEACDLMNMESFFENLMDEPEEMEHLMDICMEQNLLFAKAQVEAGAQIIGLGDAASSLIGRGLYEEFAFPRQKAMVDAIHEMGAKVNMHICGNINPIVDLVGKTGTDIIDLDSMVDLEKSANILPPNCCICGNFSPVDVLFNGTPEYVKQEVRRCMAIQDRNWNFISAGCEIPRDTPIENVLAIQEAIEEG